MFYCSLAILLKRVAAKERVAYRIELASFILVYDDVHA